MGITGDFKVLTRLASAGAFGGRDARDIPGRRGWVHGLDQWEMHQSERRGNRERLTGYRRLH